jgi:hypothetical protein
MVSPTAYTTTVNSITVDAVKFVKGVKIFHSIQSSPTAHYMRVKYVTMDAAKYINDFICLYLNDILHSGDMYLIFGYHIKP